MQAFTLPVIIGSGAIALAAWQSKYADDPRAPAVPVPTPQASGASNSSMPVGVKARGIAAVKAGTLKGAGILTSSGAGVSANSRPSYSLGGLIVGGTEAATIARQKLNELEQRARQAYEDAGDVARARGAQSLNGTLKPSPGLTGHESWEEACAKVAASVGSVVGTAACNAIPGVGLVAASTVCATLGAMVFGYLGERLGAWARDAYNKVKGYLDEQWEKAKNAIVDVAEDAGNAIADAASDVVDFVGDIW